MWKGTSRNRVNSAVTPQHLQSGPSVWTSLPRDEPSSSIFKLQYNKGRQFYFLISRHYAMSLSIRALKLPLDFMLYIRNVLWLIRLTKLFVVYNIHVIFIDGSHIVRVIRFGNINSIINKCLSKTSNRFPLDQPAYTSPTGNQCRTETKRFCF